MRSYAWKEGEETKPEIFNDYPGKKKKKDYSGMT